MQMADSLAERIQDSSLFLDINLISTTANFLLNQVQRNLDFTLLDQNKLKAQIGEFNLKEEVLQPVIDIFAL